MDPRTYEQQAPLIPQLPQMPLLPQQMITSGTRKDCIRLRGLPYEAQVEHILEFLGEHAKSIVYQGVHMVYNAQVRKQKNTLLFFFVCCVCFSFFLIPSSSSINSRFGQTMRMMCIQQCKNDARTILLFSRSSSASAPLSGCSLA